MNDEERKIKKELDALPKVDIWENYKEDHLIDPDDFKYRIESYEDYESASNILKPQFRELYTPEKEQQYSEEKAALDSLLSKLPSELIRPEKQRLVILLRAKGLSLKEICQKVELTKPTVIKIIRQFASEISKLKRIDLEELAQLFHFTLRKRIETFGKIQAILMAELETINVKDIPTDKLIELIIKCDKAVADYLLEKIVNDVDPASKLSKTNLY